jgi:hypothetical protein
MRKQAPKWTALVAGGVALGLATIGVGASPTSAAWREPPDNLRVVELDHTSATVRWDPTGWASSYTVIWTPAPPPEWVGWLRTDDPAATIPIAYPGQKYTVTVQAKRGRTTRSSSISFVAPDQPAAPIPPTPENVTAAVSPGSVTVAWDPSFVEGEEADTYLVRWADHTGTKTTDTSLTLEFAAGAKLEITVAARNGDNRDSPPSDPLRVTVPPADEWEDLGRPTNLRLVAGDDGTVTRVEWDPPAGGVEPVIYRLNYRFADQNFESWIAENSEPFIDVPAQIGELIVCPPGHNPGQTWIIWVTAHSEGETSPRSAEATICLP